MTEYEEFIDSLQAKKYKPIMTHLPSSIKLACKFYPGYLSDEELQERQYSGRYWDIRSRDIDGGHILFIVLDNQDILCVTKEEYEESVEAVLDRGYAINFLPDSLRGMYYND